MESKARIYVGLLAFGALVGASEWAPGTDAWASPASGDRAPQPPGAQASEGAPTDATSEPEVVCGVGQSACGSICFSPAAGQLCCPDRQTVCGVGQSCCGHNCYYPAQGQVCCAATSTVCGVGQACCGASCYRPSAGESCH